MFAAPRRRAADGACALVAGWGPDPGSGGVTAYTTSMAQRGPGARTNRASAVMSVA